MEISGYMIEVELTDDALRVQGTNKASHMALVKAEELADRVVHKSEDWKQPVVIPRSEIAAVELKAANALVNGKVTVTTVDGRKVQLHFRRKSNGDFAALAAALAHP